MTKMTKEERERWIEKAEKARDDAPVMNPEDAERLHKKWEEDGKSLGDYLVRTMK